MVKRNTQITKHGDASGSWGVLGQSMAPVPLVRGGARFVDLGERDGSRNVGLFCLGGVLARGGVVRWNCDHLAVVEVITRGSSKDGHL